MPQQTWLQQLREHEEPALLPVHPDRSHKTERIARNGLKQPGLPKLLNASADLASAASET